ncbi:prepilin peptidase [Spirilliplanes yamanashiensis]|uniref:Prepilin peptidase n=1 Tax=Spirilliplanes yamanashiensis TaxID=42233 RepID=A0A8J4DLX8_9ACTN|nr:A24 family peptidase [Spirilliplanes yamanashiensis]MDP9816174.1 leader peptidase (prepilin peptidase)/N-methyltransferase [Spirilliplanes yamanashiensis]GIJ05699.1 prepilin peptidase [Spirilliplanes yamanashiensis]
MTAVLLTVAGLLGLAVGSFLNVVIHRVPRDESLVRPGSHCPACEAPVRARHNVPVVSWLVLRGRCADCRAPISVRYPLVEAGTAALFVAVTAHFGLVPELPAFLYLAAIAVALTMIDIDVHRLPNAIVLPSYAVAAVLLFGAAALDSDWGAVVRGLAAMALLLLAYQSLRLAKPGGMGLGDVKLAGLLGLYLGWLGWGWVAVGGFAAFLLGGVVGIGLLATRRAGRSTHVPFGPAMLAGAFLAVFAAPAIAGWYLDLLSVPTIS